MTHHNRRGGAHHKKGAHDISAKVSVAFVLVESEILGRGRQLRAAGRTQVGEAVLAALAALLCDP